MPTYSYYCQFCDVSLDIFHSITDTSKQYCPKCKKLLKRKVTYPAGFIFKGSGFYETDYKKKENEE